MADKPFVYQDIFENAKPDTTKYRKITGDYVSTIDVDGKKILKVAPEGLTYEFNAFQNHVLVSSLRPV